MMGFNNIETGGLNKLHGSGEIFRKLINVSPSPCTWHSRVTDLC